MKLSALLAITEEDASEQQQEHALLTELKKAVKEIEADIDYDFQSGEMDYHRGQLLGSKSGVFGNHGQCMAEATEILDHVDTEKVTLLVAGFDGNWEDVYIVPTNSEMLVKRAGEAGKYVVKFRSKTYELDKDTLEKVLIEFYDSELVEYERIGDRKERNWDDDLDYDGMTRGTYNSLRRAHQRHEDDGYEPDLTEDDYKFETEYLYGALIYKNLHHS